MCNWMNAEDVTNERSIAHFSVLFYDLRLAHRMNENENLMWCECRLFCRVQQLKMQRNCLFMMARYSTDSVICDLSRGVNEQRRNLESRNGHNRHKLWIVESKLPDGRCCVCVQSSWNSWIMSPSNNKWNNFIVIWSSFSNWAKHQTIDDEE